MERKYTLTILIMIFLLLLTPTIMAETVELNLDKALEMTLKDNLSLKIAQKNLESKEIQFEKSKAENLLNQSNYNELQAEYSYINAKKSYIDTAHNLLDQTVQQYTNIMLKEKNLVIVEKQIVLNERLLNETKAQYEVGEKSQLDILEQQIELNDFLQQKEELANEYKQLKTELKVYLGINENEDIRLTELKAPEIIELNEQQISKTALKNSWEVKINELNLELAEVDKKRKEIVSSSELDKKLTDITVETAQLQLEKQKEDIKNNSRELYHQISNLENNIELQKEKIQQARENYEILVEQNNAGLITKNNLYQGEISFLQAEQQLYSSYMNYYIQAQQLENFMYPNTGVLENEEQ
ncbi:MAG: TolC family protein [Bacillota bacterium]